VLRREFGQKQRNIKTGASGQYDRGRRGVCDSSVNRSNPPGPDTGFSSSRLRLILRSLQQLEDPVELPFDIS
jgi:hypothetical protein